ncbi:MAG: hypothetical protein B7Y39_12535 [Bdellovibrio sp. 28-41-41]|nr:MAG: hypothetical protein B7Y39_12535 [Bdellovibrio sp. 28-41-41]
MKVNFNFLIFILIFNVYGQAKIKVVTTLPSFADITSIVGGEEVEVSALIKGTQDPHFVDPKPDLILKLNRADFLIRAGLGLEDGWLPPLLTGARNGKIQTGGERDLDASTLVVLKEISKTAINRGQGDVHPGGNPHFMLDPRNGILVAKAIAERLGKIDTSKASIFKTRAESFSQDLTKKIITWEKTLANLKNLPIITYHRSWIYFSDWAGLNEVGYVEPKPGVPPAPDHIVKLSQLAREKKVKFVLIEPYYPKGNAEDVARFVGATFLQLPTEVQGSSDATTYINVFDEIVHKLAAKKM